MAEFNITTTIEEEASNLNEVMPLFVSIKLDKKRKSVPIR
jgi:hypothetical protein